MLASASHLARAIAPVGERDTIAYAIQVLVSGGMELALSKPCPPEGTGATSWTS